MSDNRLLGDPPFAYLISFRSYGTWLHGDQRGSMDRNHNAFAAPPRPRERALERYERGVASAPVVLDASARSAVADGIALECELHRWVLHAVHVRTNHVHAIVTGDRPPERVMNVLKGAATRELRGRGLVGPETRLWSRHGSTVYLWTEAQVESAWRYVVQGQGNPLP